MSDLEQERRHFKRDHPLLYQYIRDREVAKALDSAGDMAGERYAPVANKLYSLSSIARRSADAARTTASEQR